VLVRF